MLGLPESYSKSHPRSPHPELGLVQAVGVHRANYFVSDAESTGLALLKYAFFLTFGHPDNAKGTAITSGHTALDRKDRCRTDP
jgi:hypothetical protein